MKNRPWTFIAALVLLAVLGKFYAVPLVAQVRFPRLSVIYIRFREAVHVPGGSVVTVESAIVSSRRHRYNSITAG